MIMMTDDGDKDDGDDDGDENEVDNNIPVSLRITQ